MNNTSPIVQVKSRKSEDTYRAGDRSRSSSVHQNAVESPTAVSRAAYINPLMAHPVITDGTMSGPRGGSPRGSHSQPPSATKPRPPPQHPRDARLHRESVADLADFIRSTGPPGAVPRPASSSGNAFSRAANSSAVRTASGPVPVPVAKASMDSGRTSMSTNNPNRPRYQPRDAVVDSADDSKDLIDFIRR